LFALLNIRARSRLSARAQPCNHPPLVRPLPHEWSNEAEQE
jgi:hypothetical protein